jgi:predicted alpha/beta-fold hydrolase
LSASQQRLSNSCVDPAKSSFLGPLEIAKFRSRAPWWGADLQTLRNILVARSAELPQGETRRIALPLLDGSGDVLSGLLNEPVAAESRPLVVLIHGLSGTEDSAYMLASTRFWVGRGHRVLRLNLRGAGPSRSTCGEQYHAGRTGDLRDALAGLPPSLASDGFVLVGYSLGGNMLLKFLAEHGANFPIIAAASVSAPIDLAAASERFLDVRNWVYHQHLLRNMKRECLAAPVELDATDSETVMSCRSILEFDDKVVAPRNGFRDAAHYYRENHARRFLAEISLPTLLVHALNDPWIPSAAYTRYPWKENSWLHPVLTPSGGHVGFHDRDDSAPYHDRCIGAFFDAFSDAQMT